MDNIHIWSSGPQWDVVRSETHYFARKQSVECMRLSRDGSFGIGNGTPRVEEEFMFLTHEGAIAFIEIARRLEGDPWESGSVFLSASTNVGIGLTACSRSNLFEFRSSGKTVAAMDHNGVLIKFDLPHLVAVWVRTSRLGRALKQFWYGEKYAA